MVGKLLGNNLMITGHPQCRLGNPGGHDIKQGSVQTAPGKKGIRGDIDRYFADNRTGFERLLEGISKDADGVRYLAELTRGLDCRRIGAIELIARMAEASSKPDAAVKTNLTRIVPSLIGFLYDRNQFMQIYTSRALTCILLVDKDSAAISGVMQAALSEEPEVRRRATSVIKELAKHPVIRQRMIDMLATKLDNRYAPKEEIPDDGENGVMAHDAREILSQRAAHLINIISWTTMPTVI